MVSSLSPRVLFVSFSTSKVYTMRTLILIKGEILLRGSLYYDYGRIFLTKWVTEVDPLDLKRFGLGPLYRS